MHFPWLLQVTLLSRRLSSHRLTLCLSLSSAFNAITSCSVVFLDLSYGMPTAVNCLRGRKMLPPRHFSLSSLAGWTCNIVSICKRLLMMLLLQFQVSLCYIILTTVLFLFPPELPATGSNMSELFISGLHASCVSLTACHSDYSVVVLVIVILISTLQWIFDGRKNFTGPKIESETSVSKPAPTQSVSIVEPQPCEGAESKNKK